jgi:hypothetical protein
MRSVAASCDDSRMGRGTAAVVALTLAAAVAVAACQQAAELLPANKLECGGTPAGLCGDVAKLAVSRMNLAATGAILKVDVTPVPDCAKWGRANFRSLQWADAQACWEVAVTGESSHGGGGVVLRRDGTLEASW